MTDRKKLEPMLRAFKNGNINIEYAVTFILQIFSTNKRFNINSFKNGIWIGGIFVYILIYLFTQILK